MNRLPPVLAADHCADYVEDIARDVRLSIVAAYERILANPSRFPHADRPTIETRLAAIRALGAVWYL